ncbi:hydroxyacid dehydrogenase [Rhizobium sp. LC145]|jgi:D-3-phosphoglycerate dehydrogenase / 2-oxoglutarate reductase|uniref:hydroxyacid dehydrogenase n=1 Tax=Rhizobium sp. LC145 TaxID=1120688 RepID=UPI00062A39D3|nr:hydroxyacid dehydrogenase [Rhizobium sp. LC145]KKX25729.1 2-hydroxyacid dehydrogenase [Rhizobium sp. LC145]TKT58022.1 hydroxyacid dehydrogenase [Rhizobiaceae bacterium LC148]
MIQNKQHGERRRRILVTHNKIAEKAIRLLNEHDVDVFFSPPYDPSDVVAKRAAELMIDGLMVRQGRITQEVIAASPNLKVIAKHGVGVDNVDIAAAAKRGIPVLRAMGSNSRAVAEHTIALALALVKEILPLDRAVKNGGWPKPTFVGKDILGATIGLIGYGGIGRETARMAEALGMEVVVHDPFAPGAAEADGFASADDIDAMLPALDILSIHCPLTAVSRDLIDARRLALMKPSAVIVNTARGGIINEQALAEALSAGTIAGAALDSFSIEPPPADSPLWALNTLIATPHIGGVTHGSADSMAEIAARHIISVLDGNAPDERSLARPIELSA